MASDKYELLNASIQAGLHNSVKVAEQCERAFLLSRPWALQVLQMHIDLPSAALLKGALSASVEVVSHSYLGLVRASTSSLRIYYELMLAWMYFKDHPIEWKNIENGRSQISLPGEILKYLRSEIPFYEMRWKVLSAKKTRIADDPYKVMSAFVHGGLLSTIPNASSPADLFQGEGALSQLPTFVKGVDEYISDVWVASHFHNWESLSDGIKTSLGQRLGASAKADLFS